MRVGKWFVFDLGNVVVKLAYERVIASICATTAMSRDKLIALMEEPGGYRDLERGASSFRDFYDFLRERAGYRGTYPRLRRIWADFFDGPVEGIEDLLERVRREYRVAFLSNSNEIHEEVIPREFALLFRRDDRFVFSHRCQLAKPDPAIFQHLLQLLPADPRDVIFVDDMAENVRAAVESGLQAFEFTTARELSRRLEAEGLLRLREE